MICLNHIDILTNNIPPDTNKLGCDSPHNPIACFKKCIMLSII